MKGVETVKHGVDLELNLGLELTWLDLSWMEQFGPAFRNRNRNPRNRRGEWDFSLLTVVQINRAL